MQRVGFARLFFHRPKYALLDESTSSLDEDNENFLYSNCEKLGIILISVSHRHTTKRFHNEILTITPNGEWALRKISEEEKEKKGFEWNEIEKYQTEMDENDKEINNQNEDEFFNPKSNLVEKEIENDGKTGFFNIYFIIILTFF